MVQSVNVIWAAGATDRVQVDAVVKRVRDLWGGDRGDVDVTFTKADLNGPRIPFTCVVVGAGFPYKAFLYDWQKNQTPFFVIALERDVHIPFDVCQQVMYL